MQPGGGHSRFLPQPFVHQLAEMPLGQFFQQWLRPFGQPGAASQGFRIGLGTQFSEQIVRQRRRLRQPLLERRLTLAANQRIRVLALGQEQKADLPAITQERQRHIERPPARRPPGAVAIETEHQIADYPEQPLHVLGGGGGAQRSDRVTDAVLSQRHHIHVAFDH